MAERFKAPVLKTDDGQPSASSNLAPTANESAVFAAIPRVSEQTPTRRGSQGLGISSERLHHRPESVAKGLGISTDS